MLVDQTGRFIPDLSGCRLHIWTTHPLRPVDGSPVPHGGTSPPRLLRDVPTSWPRHRYSAPHSFCCLGTSLSPARQPEPSLPWPGSPTFRIGAWTGITPPIGRGPSGQ